MRCRISEHCRTVWAMNGNVRLCIVSKPLLCMEDRFASPVSTRALRRTSVVPESQTQI